MKTILIIALILILLLMAAQVLISQSSGRTEQQAYRVVRQEGKIEIRYYPEAIMAGVELKGTYESRSSDGFRQLAGYIFGRNDRSQKIAMTSPVHMQQEGDTFRMQFVMPAAYSLEELPAPEQPGVALQETGAFYAAALRFSGYARSRQWEAKKEELRQALKAAGISYDDHLSYLGYNPPYQFLNRRNEVIVRLTDYRER